MSLWPTLTVADVDASLAFYSERLGFKPDLRLQDPDDLETRPDIDIQKLGLYGVSSGATHGVWMTAVHRRFQVAVLASGGLLEISQRKPIHGILLPGCAFQS
jgi:catechol 2,3-dioxygenase-like lactoylglutathione lyase family enzyme